MGDLQGLAMKVYPGESKEIRVHLVVRGSLEAIHDSQVRIDLRKILVDAELTIERVLEKAVHLEAVTRIEEEEKEPRVAVVQLDNTERLISSVNQLVVFVTLAK